MLQILLFGRIFCGEPIFTGSSPGEDFTGKCCRSGKNPPHPFAWINNRTVDCSSARHLRHDLMDNDGDGPDGPAHFIEGGEP
jgi:hypothetical protein